MTGGRQALRERIEVGVEGRIIGCPSLDPVPEAVHASEGVRVRGEEIGAVGEYGEQEALGDVVA